MAEIHGIPSGKSIAFEVLNPEDEVAIPVAMVYDDQVDPSDE